MNYEEAVHELGELMAFENAPMWMLDEHREAFNIITSREQPPFRLITRMAYIGVNKADYDKIYPLSWNDGDNNELQSPCCIVSVERFFTERRFTRGWDTAKLAPIFEDAQNLGITQICFEVE